MYMPMVTAIKSKLLYMLQKIIHKDPWISPCCLQEVVSWSLCRKYWIYSSYWLLVAIEMDVEVRLI